MGTGIVFVVLVAIWVAYFVQYWSRRREHLATARSVEAFSEAMRVLERRPPRRAPVTDRISSAYSVSPARVVSARPQVMAKSRPAPNPGGAPGMRTSPSPRPARSTTSPPARPGRQRPARPQAGPQPSRKVRGQVLLATLFATVVLAVLAPLTTLLWWVPLVGVATVIASFLWLRAAVQAEARIRRAAARRRGPRRHAPTTSSAPPVASEDGPEAADLAGEREAELLEGRTVTAAEGASAEGGADGWSPVPVPPPTYTLKAKAEYRTAGVEEAVRPEEPVGGESGEVAAPPSTAGEAADEARAAYGT